MSGIAIDDFDASAWGVVVAGHGVAGGSGVTSPYPEGSISLQIPFFEAAGLDLAGIHRGTINLDLAPVVFTPIAPQITIPGIRWTDEIPAETFSFFRCRVETGSDARAGWIYRPHPETKVEHFQAPTVVEILAPWMEGVTVGSRLLLRWHRLQARADRSEA